MPDCVSIVPLTSDGRIILINQYRHAVGRSVLECPGGTIHRHHDDPISAAKRELLEETGYAAGRLVSVGSHDLNPGGQTTRIHTFVAQDCERVAEPMLESFESLTTQLVTREDLADLVRGSGHFQTTTLASLMLGLQHIDNSTRTFGTDGVWA
jgi:8-oxo-dGTP pyrophosphatase MutT (NUDIX family)